MGVVENLWRRETPGHTGWSRSARPSADDKYFIVSTDTHINEPGDIYTRSLPEHLASHLSRIEVDENGQRWEITPGVGKRKVFMHENEGDAEDKERAKTARTIEQVVADMDRDGVDVQIVFPNRGLQIFGQRSHDLMYAMASVQNDWIEDMCKPAKDRCLPMALVPTADLDRTFAELDRIAKKGFFRGVTLPAKPIYGPGTAGESNYNLPEYDALWARLQDLDLTATFHVATGQDPRIARYNGGAIINYTIANTTAFNPVVTLCTSGALSRFPKLRFALIESGVGWVPWLLQTMDEGYRKHHIWVSPKLDRLPSEYFIENGFATFQEDKVGVDIVAQNSRFDHCFMWANDYPHHEGTWPHSSAAIEREMGRLTEMQRAAILGGNAVRCFKLDDLADRRLAPAQKVSA